MKYTLIGTGSISKTYFSALENIPGAEIVACVSRRGKKPAAAPHLPSYKKPSDVDVPFDAVIIITPNGFHHVSAIEAAAMKKHVLCEKPLDITLKSMKQMIDACKAAEVTLGVAYQRRMSPDNLSIKKLIDEDAFDRILAVDLSCKFWRDQAYFDSGDYRGGYALDGGGPFMQQACHNLDLYQWFFGMPVEVKGILGNLLHNIEVEDHGAVIFRHADGMIGSFVASTLAKPGMPARLEVVTEKGYFVTLDDRICEWKIEGVDDPREAEKKDGRQSIPTEGNNPIVSDSTRHELIIRNFEQAIALGREPLVSGESAKRTTELILQIYKNKPLRCRPE